MRCEHCNTRLTTFSIGRKVDAKTGCVHTCRWCEEERASTCAICGDPLTTVSQRLAKQCKRCADVLADGAQ